VLVSIGGPLLLNEPRGPRIEACTRLVQDINLGRLIGQTVTSSPDPNHQNGCRALLVDSESVRWLTISSEPSGTLIGDSFGHHTQEFARKGFILKKFPWSESRAVLASPSTESGQNTVFMFEDEQGSHMVEFNALVVEQELIDTISTRLLRKAQQEPNAPM
jgi:hypothetical protein